MDADARRLISEAIIGSAFEISNVLGCGFLEKVYQRAMARELGLRGLRVGTDVRFPVVYKDSLIGEYVADLIVEQEIVVELKCVERFANEHVAQCINYLKASNLPLALLINFQRPKIEWKRIAFNLRASASICG